MIAYSKPVTVGAHAPVKAWVSAPMIDDRVEPLRVGQLRELLAGLPDDTPVAVIYDGMTTVVAAAVVEEEVSDERLFGWERQPDQNRCGDVVILAQAHELDEIGLTCGDELA